MYHYVVSKMADHHAPLFPLWYEWYKQIYRADKIIILAVRTPRSRVSETMEFFLDKPNVHIEPFSMSYFDDVKIYERLKHLVERDIADPLAYDFSFLQADADEFFEPLQYARSGSFVPYNWIELCSEGLDVSTLKPLWWTGSKAATLNCTGTDRIKACGHYEGYLGPIDTLWPTCFHWCYTGFDDFLAKTRAVMLSPNTPPWHQPAQRKILDTRGAIELKALYKRIVMGDLSLAPCDWATPMPSLFADRFRAWLSKLSMPVA